MLTLVYHRPIKIGRRTITPTEAVRINSIAVVDARSDVQGSSSSSRDRHTTQTRPRRRPRRRSPNPSSTPLIPKSNCATRRLEHGDPNGTHHTSVWGEDPSIHVAVWNPRRSLATAINSRQTEAPITQILPRVRSVHTSECLGPGYECRAAGTVDYDDSKLPHFFSGGR